MQASPLTRGERCVILVCNKGGSYVTIRVQVLLEEEEKELFVQEAQRAGMSLSAWIREAGKERLKSRPARLKLETPDDLRVFFASCDAGNE